jgi:hypothetical protein
MIRCARHRAAGRRHPLYELKLVDGGYEFDGIQLRLTFVSNVGLTSLSSSKEARPSPTALRIVAL